MGDFLMPSLGADMVEATLSEWLVKPGDQVHRGDVVAVVDTDKASLEIEVFESGEVERILVPAGQTVPVGTAIARIRPSSEPTSPAVLPVPATPPELVEPTPPAAPVPFAEPFVLDAEVGTAAAVEAPVSKTPAPARAFASPLARRLAREMGIALEAIRGTGPEGAITREDVERAAGAAKEPDDRAAPQAADRDAAMRRAIGSLMARSKREIPHYYLSTTIDMTNALTWMEARNAQRPITTRLIPAAMMLKAVTRAVMVVPEMNGFYAGEEFHPSATVHLGVAVSLRGGGLVAPGIRDADSLSLDQMMAALRDLVERARKGRMRSSEMSDPTITVTSLGDQGVDSVFGVIYPPQVALVGFGRILERPWAGGGMVGARRVVTATLSADHRASDGHSGGLFLAALDKALQRPEEL